MSQIELDRTRALVLRADEIYGKVDGAEVFWVYGNTHRPIASHEEYIRNHYPILSAWRDGTLLPMWEAQRDAFASIMTPGQPKDRAGELAAAKLSYLSGQEYSVMEYEARNTKDHPLYGPNDESLFLLWMGEQKHNINYPLIEMSGNRAIYDDIEIIRMAYADQVREREEAEQAQEAEVQ